MTPRASGRGAFDPALQGYSVRNPREIYEIPSVAPGCQFRYGPCIRVVDTPVTGELKRQGYALTS